MAAAAAVVFRPLFQLSFWGDDTYLILLTSTYNLIELLFLGPARKISATHFMPLLGLTFHLGYLLFDLDFTGRNLHNLLWLVAVGYAAYLLFRELGLRSWPSLCGGIASMVMPATVSVAGLYSNRHYLLGLAFAILALIALLRWSRQQKPSLLCLSLFFYFLSIMSKRGLPPLPLLSTAMVVKTGAPYRKAVLGYISILFGYFVMRWASLGTAIGGYSPGIEVLSILGYFPKCVPRLLQTPVWGGYSPGVLSYWAAAIGALLVISNFIMSLKVRKHLGGFLSEG